MSKQFRLLSVTVGLAGALLLGCGAAGGRDVNAPEGGERPCGTPKSKFTDYYNPNPNPYNPNPNARAECPPPADKAASAAR